MAAPLSATLPPRYVEYTKKLPAGFNLVTKAQLPPPKASFPHLAWKAVLVVGKPEAAALPVR
jgi:hypothetical protein